MDLIAWMNESLNKLENHLQTIFAAEITSPSEHLIQSMRYSSLEQGKRIRPLFTIAAGTVSNADENNLLIIGNAIELIHCFSLIHDDLPIMDNDTLRRGRPTNHIIYGDAIAMLAGDALQAMAFALLSDAKLQLPATAKLKLINMLANAIGINGMVGGQAVDWMSTSKQLTIDQLQEMHSLKTGHLLKTAILAGYIAGISYSDEEFDKLIQIADKIGLLFQVIDDIIDITQDTQTLGKTANKDFIQNKATYVSLLGIEKSKLIAAELHQQIIQQLNELENSAQLAYLADIVYYRNN